MDFEIPEELKMVQSLVRDFVNNQLKPLERDILGRAGDLSDARMYLPLETEAKLVGMAKDIGLWGVNVPEELGGAGLNTLGNCLVEEELAQTIIPFNFGDITPILFDCSGEQRVVYLLPVLGRQKQAYVALMEPDKGADISGMQMKAEKKNGYYVLNGRKVSFSRPGRDYYAIVFAVTVGSEEENRVTCFLVDGDTSGFRVIGGEERSGWQSQVREPIVLDFQDCRVPAENILGEEGGAFRLGRKWLPSRRVARGARCVGVARRLLEEATVQAQTRQSFGQPVSRQPSTQAALADIAMFLHAGRLMVYEAAWEADRGESIRRKAAMVKLFTTQMLYSVADRVAHVYGGPSYVAGLPVERLCRQALQASATELALELQRSIIARDILKGLKV
jgi:acyl-CoA dehydrogenase